MMISWVRKCGLIGVSALALSHAGPALAQESPNAVEEGGADIVVTARRVEERLQDVPVAIAVVSQQQLANRNIVTSADLVLSIPSLSVSNTIGSNTTSFSLRGFGSSIGTDPSVGVYFADAVSLRGGLLNQQSGNGAGPGSFFDLQNVQVLKGPQGTLFGRNSTGGAILLVPQKPTDQFEGYVEGSYGNYDMYRGQAVLNIPLGDQARLRLGIDRMKRDGYMKNLSGIGPKAANDTNYTAVRASFVVDLTPDLENYTIVSYLNSDTNGEQLHVFRANTGEPGSGLFANLAQKMLDRYGNANKLRTTLTQFPDTFFRTETWQVINTTTWKASDDVTIKNIAMYGELKNDALNPLFGVLFELSDANSLLGTNYAPGTALIGFTGSASNPNGNLDKQATFSDELRIEGDSLDGKLVWQAGGFLESSRPLGTMGQTAPNTLANCNYDNFQCAGVVPTQNRLLPDGRVVVGGTAGIPLAAGATSISSLSTRYRTLGIYAQGTYNLTERLSLTVGARYNWARQSNTTRQRQLFYAYNAASPLTPTDPVRNACVVGTQPDCSIFTETSSKKPTWTIGAEYKPTDDILTYAKWSRGFRQGGLVQNTPAAFRTFGPESVDAYELGVKTSFRGAVRGTFNVSGFYNDLSNQQLQVTFNRRDGTTAQSTGVFNAGSSRVYGVEVDTTISPFDGLSLEANYAYLRTKVGKLPALADIDPVFSIASAARSGDPLLYTPKHKLALTGAYTLPLDEGMGRVTLSATYTYSSKQAFSYQRRGPLGTTQGTTGGIGALAGTSIGAERNLVDANITWNRVMGSQIDLSVFGSNILDKTYVIYSLDTGGGGGLRGYQIGLPGLYGARVRYNF